MQEVYIVHDGNYNILHACWFEEQAIKWCTDNGYTYRVNMMQYARICDKTPNRHYDLESASFKYEPNKEYKDIVTIMTYSY